MLLTVTRMSLSHTGLPSQSVGVWGGSIQYSVMVIRGNGVTLRTQKVIQGGDNGHVGRPCEVSLTPPCPEPVLRVTGRPVSIGGSGGQGQAEMPGAG